MTQQVSVRLCLPCETDLVGAFYDGVVGDLVEHINWPKWTYKVYPSTAFVKQMTVQNSQFVCTLNGKLVAAFVLNEDPQGAYDRANWSKRLSDGEYLVCHAVAVSPEMQNKGVGRQIVDFCKKFAADRGYKAIRLDVVPGNLPAKKLYENCGFRYRGDVDLLRGYQDIPLFSMYEYNL